MDRNVKWTDVANVVGTWTIVVLAFVLILVGIGVDVTKISADVWVAIAATFVALCALGVSIYQIRLSEKNNIISVRPSLNLVYAMSPNDGKVGISIENRGLGPAIIKKITVIKNDKIYDYEKNHRELYTLAKNKADKNNETIGYKFTGVSSDAILDRGDVIWLIYIAGPTPTEVKYFNDFFINIKISIDYESMHGEKLNKKTKS